MPVRTSHLRCSVSFVLGAILLAFAWSVAIPTFAAGPDGPPLLAAVPPMGWNDWDRYECGFTAETILANAQALAKTGLAARGYNTVTIDDCWMQKDRDSSGNLQADPHRFPQGIPAVAQAIHALGLNQAACRSSMPDNSWWPTPGF